MDRILVDTDILIDFTKGKSEILKSLFAQQNLGQIELFINPVTIAEFMADKSLGVSKTKKTALEFLGRFAAVQTTRKVGFLAGEYLHKGLVLNLGDSLIAANCVEGNLKLCTRNRKHFKKVSNLKFF